jgi:hypothetical protein
VSVREQFESLELVSFWGLTGSNRV